MKILMLSPNQVSRYNRTHQIFRNEIGRQHNVVYYGLGYPNYASNKPIPQVVRELGGNFDIIITYGLRYTEPFIGIGEITTIPKVHIAVDYFPVGGGSGTYERNHNLFRRDKYNLYFGVVGDIVKNLVKNGVCKRAFLLPFSVDTNVYKNLNLKKDIDVFAVFSTGKVYPNRDRIQKFIKSIQGVSTYTKKVIHGRYISMINRSKLCITSNNKFRSLSIKYYEIMACGSLLLADEPEDLSQLGFVNGKHLILYKNNLKDLKNKIKYCLSHDKEREEIAYNGMKFIRENHSNEIRVKQMTNIIKEEFGIK